MRCENAGATDEVQHSAAAAPSPQDEASGCGGWQGGTGTDEGEGIWDTDCTSDSGMGASVSLQASMVHEAARWFPHTNIYARMKDDAQSQSDKKHECRDAGDTHEQLLLPVLPLSAGAAASVPAVDLCGC